MTSSSAAPPATGLDAVTTLDDVAEQLRAWRAEAGSPSFTEIARRVSSDREQRGMHPRYSPGRMTVYDAFSPGRKRLDVQLAVDIARALGIGDDELEIWRGVCVLAQQQRPLLHSVTARTGLPEQAHAFVGRPAELQSCLSAEAPVIVQGMAGTGKSALAFEAAAGLVRTGTVHDAVVVTLGDLRGVEDAPDCAAICDAVLRATGGAAAPDEDAADLAVRVVDALAEQRLALVVDDVADAEQITALVAARPRTPVLITTRSRLEVEGAVQLPMELWTTEETLAALRTLAGEELLAQDPVSAQAVAEFIDGLPLAASLAAARMRRLDDWTLADHATALQRRLASHRLDEPVSASIALTASSLSPDAARALRLLAAQPCQSIAAPALAALLDVSDAGADAVIAELDRAHAVLRMQRGRLSLHSLVRAYAAAQSLDDDPPSARESALSRLTDAMMTQLWTSVSVLHPGHATVPAHRGIDPSTTDPEASAVWLEDELDSLVELAVARSEADPRIAIELSDALGRHFDNRGRWPLGLSLLRVAAESARRLGDLAAEARAEVGIGAMAVRLRLPNPEQHLERARTLGLEAGALGPVISALNALSIIAMQNNEPRISLGHLQEALALSRAEGLTGNEMVLMDNIAVVLRYVGDLEGSLEVHEQAAAQASENDDRMRLSTSLGNVSEVLRLLGRLDDAVDAARRARTIAESINSALGYGYATVNLGHALHLRGDQAEAEEVLQEVIRYADEQGLPTLELTAIVTLGHVLLTADPVAAGRRLQRGLELSEQMDQIDERSRALHGLGALAVARGDDASARELLTEAFALLPSEEVPEAAEITALLQRVAVG